MTDTVQTIPVPRSEDGALRNILRPRNDNNTSGFQRAHIVGRAFMEQNELRWLRDILGPNGADNALNGILLPEGNRGGLLLGVAEHLGNDVAAEAISNMENAA